MDLIMKDEVYKVVGAAIDVHRELGNGFLEAVYQEALAIEFSDLNIPFTSQPKLAILYKNRPLNKTYVPDFICFEEIILELKSMNKLTGNEDAQMLNYLKTSRKKVGILINFGSPGKLEWKKFVY